VYDRIPWATADVGGSNNNSYIWDSLFQEIDIETDELLFEWRASDHFDFSNCYNPWKLQNEEVPGKEGWDWFHLNSVDKDNKGNYLISSRYSHSLAYIDHKTGKVLWQLGGKNNSFTDLSGGIATGLQWQHHATWQDDYTAVTVYDNQAVNWNRTSESRGLKIRLDQEAMTAEVVAMAIHPQHYIVHSQGSMSQLSNGNLLIGYGYAAAMTEYSPDGKEVLCDWQYASLRSGPHGIYSPGLIQSYRTYKLPWKGFPLDSPNVAFEAGIFYVSWNGATEHRKWLLEGSAGADQNLWQLVHETSRRGFETEINMLGTNHTTFRLTAIDGDEKVLGMWVVTPGNTTSSASLMVCLSINATRYERKTDKALNWQRTQAPTTSTVNSMQSVSPLASYAVVGAVAMAMLLLLRRNLPLLSRRRLDVYKLIS
jgi:hypothetical protein